MTVEAKVTWVEDKLFLGQASSGHGVIVDGNAGKLGSTPMELVLMGMAGCTAYDVLAILGKKRQDVSQLTVRAQAERAEEEPRVYTVIDIEYVVRGRNVRPKVVEDAIRLSQEKYCSASIMLGKTARIRTAYRLEEEDGSPARD